MNRHTIINTQISLNSSILHMEDWICVFNMPPEWANSWREQISKSVGICASGLIWLGRYVPEGRDVPEAEYSDEVPSQRRIRSHNEYSVGLTLWTLIVICMEIRFQCGGSCRDCDSCGDAPTAPTCYQFQGHYFTTMLWWCPEDLMTTNIVLFFFPSTLLRH